MLATGDDDFDDFQAAPGQYGNPPPAAPLTPEVPIPSLGAGKEGTRQPLASNLFGGGDPEEEEEWGDFATVPANGSAAPQHQSLPAAAPARAAAPPAAAGSRGALRKLDAVWYLDGRTGSWVEAKVVSVDVSIQPPSYCVQLRSNGAFRETERHRLRPLLPGMPPPAGAEEGPAPAFAAHPPAAGHPPVPVHSGANGHAMPAAAAAPAPAAALGEEEDEFGDFAAAAAPPAPPPMPSFAHTHPAAASVLPAAPRAAPASPFVAPAAPGAAAAAPAAAPPPGSPRRLPSRRSSTDAASPVLQRFRSFLHAAAPGVADQLEAEERQQQQVAAQQQQQQQEDEFGEFEGGGFAPAAEQQPAPPAPAGVQRNAPLPLDLFGDEGVEDAPLELAAAALAAPAPSSAAGALAHTRQQHQQQAHGPPPPPQQHHLPTTLTDPAGRLLAVDYADRFLRAPPGALPPAWESTAEPAPAAAASHGPAVAGGMPVAAPAAAAAAVAGGWDEGEDGGFDDFVGAEGEAQPVASQQPAAQLPEPAPAAGPTAEPASSEEGGVAAAVPAPPLPPAGVQPGTVLPLDLFGDEGVEDVPLELVPTLEAPAPAPAMLAAEAEHAEQPAAAPASQLEQQQPASPPHQQQHPPSTLTDPAGRVLGVDYADRFVRAPPEHAAEPTGAGSWEEEEEEDAGFGDFAAAPEEASVRDAPQEAQLEAAPSVGAQASWDDGAQASSSLEAPPPSPPPPPSGVQPGMALPLDLFGDEGVEDAPLELVAEPATGAGGVAAVADQVQHQAWEEQQAWEQEEQQAEGQSELPLAGVVAAAPAAATAAAATAVAAAAAGGWDDDEDGGFADFMGAEAGFASLDQQPREQQLAEEAAVEAGPPGGRMSSDGLVLETTAAALHAQGAGSTPADDGGKPGLSSASPRQPPEQDQPDSPQNGISNDGSGGKPAAVLTVLRPLSARSSLEGGSRPAEPAPAAAPQQPGWAAAGPSLGPAGAHVAPGEEAATEYAVVWARLLQAAAHLLQASVAVWADASVAGSWPGLEQRPEVQQHLAAVGQLYCAAAIVRLAAQQLGLFSLVPELQEAWALAETAWQSMPPAAARPAAEEQPVAGGSQAGGVKLEAAEDAGGEEQARQEPLAAQQPPFREAALAASRAWATAAAAGNGGGSCAGGFSDAQTVLEIVQGAPARLDGMSLDDFPRLLEWSEGLCSLTLLPLSLFEGRLPVEPWVGCRPCLVPLANLWLHRVSHTPPQLD
ncbi:hypothetical protein CHLNCDRAFT_142159 [Chlorella variabilis]|uniref:Tudor domain-containing protein n=1 Tax=Chlorella variabilis TaxID=554065 RepID=E1Z7X1_CHLVA|nr:hypothetical protein CHLNCDRAFT_142159 [Chlorella variabilis]EFN57995.1 hypothetical protein CHLNCDRAFT_142159 [Chlorella variabilis]|eukprot:XP_005850097.1 hypothetical protein CHLNCDRAFT_142159 [Chlorella variabilis]